MSKFFSLFLGLGFISMVAPQSAFAFPMPQGSASQFKSMVNLPFTFTASYDFEGVVALDDCSGSLIRLENSKDSDLGLILTNGHCFEGGMPPAGTVIVNQPSSRTFRLLNPQSQPIATLTATTVVYSTMTRTDMTLYRINQTYGEILSKYGIHAMVLSSKPASMSDKIDIISGYWRRGYTCGVEKFVDQLKEGSWTFANSIRYSRPGCETIGGTSGSPITLAGTKIVVGVNNTGNEDGEACTMNNPCEVDSAGAVFYEQGISYGQQTYWLYGCLNAKSELDLNTRGCLLPR